MGQKKDYFYIYKWVKNIIMKKTKIILNRAKEYYINNKDDISKRSMEYYVNNKELIKDYQKEYYINNKELIKYYYEKNKDIILNKAKEYQKEFRKNNPLTEDKKQKIKEY